MALYQFSANYGDDGYRSAADTARENRLAQMFGMSAGYSGWQDKALGEEIGQQAGTLWKEVDPAQYQNGVNWDANLQNAVNSSLVQVDGKWFMPQQLEAQIIESSPYKLGKSPGGIIGALSNFMDNGGGVLAAMGGVAGMIGAAGGFSGLGGVGADASGLSGWGAAEAADGVANWTSQYPWLNNTLASNGDTSGILGADGGSMDWYTELQNLIDNNGSWIPTGDAAASTGAYQFPDGTTGANPSDFTYPNVTGTESTGLMDFAKQLGLSPANLMKLLATGGGGILGALSGQKPNATTTQTDIPDWLKPYYQSALGVGLNNLGQSQSLSPQESGIINNTVAGLTAPNAGLDAANKAMTDTASGKYLDLANNPQWQEAMRLLGQNYNEVIRPGTDAQFSRAGAMGVGNSAWEEMNARNSRALATGQGAATAGAWGTERQNQMTAAGAMPGFQNQMLTGNANSALGLLGMPRNIANQGLQNYASLLSSTKGPINQTQTTTANPWQTAAGGAMTGYALSNLWK